MLILRVFESEDTTPRVFKVEKDPCTIGRAHYNAIQIEDPRISGEHARLVRKEGVWFLEDLRSANGIFYQSHRLNEVKIDQNLEFFVGPVRVEAILSDVAVDQVHEKTHEIFYPPKEKKLHWVLIHFICLFGLFLAAFLGNRVHSLGTEGASEFVMPFLVFSGIVYAITGIGAIFSKLHRKKYAFTRLLIPASLLITSIVFFEVFEDTLAFNIGIPAVVIVLTILVKSGILFVSLFLAFQIILGATNKVKLAKWVGLLVFMGFFVYGGIKYFLESDSEDLDLYGSIGYPVVPLSLRNGSMDGLFKKMNKSRDKILENRAEVLKEDEDRDGTKN